MGGQGVQVEVGPSQMKVDRVAEARALGMSRTLLNLS